MPRIASVAAAAVVAAALLPAAASAAAPQPGSFEDPRAKAFLAVFDATKLTGFSIAWACGGGDGRRDQVTETIASSTDPLATIADGRIDATTRIEGTKVTIDATFTTPTRLEGTVSLKRKGCKSGPIAISARLQD